MRLLLIFTSACLLTSNTEGVLTQGSFTDARDGNKYGHVTIAGLTIMSENLRFNVPGSLVYSDEALFEKEHGRLYNFSQIFPDEYREKGRGICPKGWHIPSHGEWSFLISKLQGTKSDTNEDSYWKTITENPMKLTCSGNLTRRIYQNDPISYVNMGEMGLYATSTVGSDYAQRVWWGLVRYWCNADGGPSQLDVGIGDEKGMHVSCRCVKN